MSNSKEELIKIKIAGFTEKQPVTSNPAMNATAYFTNESVDIVIERFRLSGKIVTREEAIDAMIAHML